MAKKCMRVERKKPTKKSLEEELDFLRQLAEKNIPYSCFKEKQAVQESYGDLIRYLRNSSYNS